MEPDSSIGPYEIVGPLGAGGMGEVYRARDSRLGREVAIKVLPAEWSADADRLARLRREAQLLAQLSHPHIAQVYGLEEHDGACFVVMELAPGDTLDARIQQHGRLQLTEVVPIAEQLCEGLAAAHEQGIVHRDLKPANILVAEDDAGRLSVKLLDFGLAKSVEASGKSLGMSESPTEVAATREGVIQGTAPYMSPEQARGKPADQRTDAWAFGCVLYEMLTGDRAFTGETVSDVLAAILQTEPDLGKLPSETPAGFHRLLQRCLAKDPEQRLRNLSDIRLQLRDAIGEAAAAPGPAVSARSGRTSMVLLTTAAMVAAALAGAWAAGRMATPSALVTRLAIPLPKGHLLTSPPTISADGRTIAYATSATPSGSSSVYVRRLDQEAARLMPGSAGAKYPVLSADGSEIVFNRNGVLWKAATDGGAPSEIVSAPLGFGSVWLSPTEILVAPALGQLVRVSTIDGTAVPATEVERALGEYAHTWPQILDGGRLALFRVWGAADVRGTALLDLQTGQRRMIAPGRFGFHTGSGVLAVIDNTSNTLRAGRLDLASIEMLSGEIPVLDGFYWGIGDNRAWLAFSETGTLVYARGDPADRRLVWVDNRGAEELVDPERRIQSELKLSFSGTKVVFREHGDIWLKDLMTGTEELVVSSERGGVANFSPHFSADDTEIIFGSNRSGDLELYAQPLDRSDTARIVLERPGYQNLLSVGPDGSLIFGEIGEQTGTDLWILPPTGDPRPLLVTTASETGARISPDGTLVAYVGTQSGESEVYVMSTDGGPSVRVSRDGGFDTSWSPDGRALFYRSDEGVMRSTVGSSGELVMDAPQLFLRTDNFATDFGRSYDVGADGRLLMIRPEPNSMPDQLNVVLNWFEELEALLPRR